MPIATEAPNPADLLGERPLTLLEVADYLRISDETVRKMCESGELRGKRISRAIWRVFPSDLKAYLATL